MKRLAHPPRSIGGFTLLEAIVALVVFSLGAFALYAWLSTNVLTLNRIRERQLVEATMHSALDVVRRGNPMETPNGRRQLNGLDVSWISTLVQPIKPNVDQYGSPAIFNVGLYDTKVRVSRDGRELREFNVRQVGWKQVRTVDDI